MAKKKKDYSPQQDPQTMRWLYQITRRGTIKTVKEERPYSESKDEDKKARPVGYRFSKVAVEKGYTDKPYKKPTAEEVEMYKKKRVRSGGKKKLIVYSEKRVNKSDRQKGRI